MSDTEGILLGIAMVLVMTNVVMVLWDREAYFAAYWRILTLQGFLKMPTRKPKKSRLLSPWELLAIEYDCSVGDDSLGTELVEAMKEALRIGVDRDELERLKATMRMLSDEQGWDFSGTYNDGADEVAFRIDSPREPAFEPPPVASLVTRPPDYRQGGQVKPINPVYPPKRPAGSKPPAPVPVHWDCEDCEFGVVQSHGGSFSSKRLIEPCRRHRLNLPPTTYRNERH